MPFLGQDWRQPGEQWVRTIDGWERMRMWRIKLLENLNENVIRRLIKLASGGSLEKYYGYECIKDSDRVRQQPYVIITRCSKELKMQTTIADSFSRLDMSGAVKDIRRFNYVCKLLELLIRHKLPSLSGTAQRHVFTLLEEVLKQVLQTQNNAHVLRGLLGDVQVALVEGQYSHVGSNSLWQKHNQQLIKMTNAINSLQLKEREDDGGTMMSDLPDDCIREILHRLSDHHDILSTALTEPRNQDLAEEKGLWRELCLFHFDNQQLLSVIKNGDELEKLDAEGWRNLHTRLIKRYGGRDTFAEMLHLCRHCNALYWQLHGHPCLVPNMEPKSVPITPVMCMELITA